MIQNKIDVLYDKIITAFRARNQTKLKLLQNDFTSLLNDLDDILQTNENFLLGKWLQSAKDLGTNELEEQVYEFNARNQITTWGPTGQIVDYAMKQWAGIVRDFCLPRWALFFDELNESLSKKIPKFNNNKCKQKIFKEIEEPFGVANKEYPIEAIGDTFQIARNILRKWKGTQWMDKSD